MAQMRIDAYEVLYSANGFVPRIALKHAGNYVGQMLFMPNGAALPADTVVNNQAQLHYPLDDFQNAIDLLRNEKPIYMYYNGAGGGFENGIKTMNEKVGEGETSQQDSRRPFVQWGPAKPLWYGSRGSAARVGGHRGQRRDTSPPMVVHDLYTRGRLHPVTLWGGAFTVHPEPLRFAIGYSEPFQAFARMLMG